MNKAIILLSGGLDSVVSLAKIVNTYNEILALTFDYGQKAFISEKKASEQISKFYDIRHKIIKLDWLGEISNSTLNTEENVPVLSSQSLNNKEITQKSAKSVWVPNRNGLFINIASCFADAKNYDDIIIGANKEEGETFKDNSKEFTEAVNNSLKHSVNGKINVKAPLIECTKEDIIKIGIELNVPFEYIHSCYYSNEKHCGKCESCQRLKRALKLNGRTDIINKIFE